MKTKTAEDIFNRIKIMGPGDIRSLVSMGEAVEAMKKAFSGFSSGESQVPQRYVSRIPDSDIDLFFKPAYDNNLERIAVKILTQKTEGDISGIPTILGIVLLMDKKTGAVLSMIDGTYLTALRTGAASGRATKFLSRRNAEIVAIFGCGAQGRTQLEGVCSARRIKEAILYDLNKVAAGKLKIEMEKHLNISIHIEEDLQNLKKADIICTATNSKKPLFSRKDISKGVHINAIGSYKPDMQEIDPQIFNSGILFTDSRESVLKESGDLIKPLKDGIFSKNIIKAEIGDVITGNVTGRNTDDDITVFKSVGLGVQDLFMADLIYNKYKEV